MRLRLSISIATVFACTALSPLVSASQAGTVYYRNGKPGISKTYPGLCRHYDYARTLTLSTPPPRIYARNNVRGRREYQWVHWRITLLDLYHRYGPTRHTWSEWKLAGDFVGGYARYDTGQWFSGLTEAEPHSYRLNLRVDWWNRKGTKKVGTKMHHISPYRYSFGGGWSGPYNACGFFGEFGSGL